MILTPLTLTFFLRWSIIPTVLSFPRVPVNLPLNIIDNGSALYRPIDVLFSLYLLLLFWFSFSCSWILSSSVVPMLMMKGASLLASFSFWASVCVS